MKLDQDKGQVCVEGSVSLPPPDGERGRLHWMCSRRILQQSFKSELLL